MWEIERFRRIAGEQGGHLAQHRALPEAGWSTVGEDDGVALQPSLVEIATPATSVTEALRPSARNRGLHDSLRNETHPATVGREERIGSTLASGNWDGVRLIHGAQVHPPLGTRILSNEGEHGAVGREGQTTPGLVHPRGVFG